MVTEIQPFTKARFFLLLIKCHKKTACRKSMHIFRSKSVWKDG